jgi:NADH-quinone oxidoreductase subunit E
MTLSVENENRTQFERLCEILEQYDYQAAKLIPILQAVQDEYRYLPEDVLTYVATALHLPPARVFGVASFYAHFTLKPKGKYIVKLCDGTACHVKGTPKLLSAIRDHLDLKDGQDTTPDMKITVETVSCLGACGLAPVMMINEDVHGLLSPEEAVELIEALEDED